MSIYSNGRFDARPDIVAADYETALTDGSPSTKYYRPDFRVISAAFSWLEGGTLRNCFVQGEEAVGTILRQLNDWQTPLVVHNLQFEQGVTLHRFPGLALNWHADTMRLVQVYDNGGSDFDDAPWTFADLEQQLLEGLDGGKPLKKKPKTGLGLANSVKRLLAEEFHDHKKEAYDWLHTQGIKKGHEGRNLHLLPLEILERYNIGDSDNTYRLYEKTTSHFATIGYNWQFDHGLYRGSVRNLIMSESRGVRVNRPKLQAFREEVAAEIEEIGKIFRGKFLTNIQALEQAAIDKALSKLKTEKGRLKRLAKYAEEPIVFNVGSNKQLAELFMGQLGIKPSFFTDKGAPSFRSVMLNQWGEGGAILLKRRKRMLVLKQCDALLGISEFDSRWHVQLKACGTKTSRYSGGSH